MTNKVLLATFNEGKIERFKSLIAQTGLSVEVFTPADLSIPPIHIEENGSSLTENAEIKARAFLGKVDMPILANDAGFWVEGEGLIEAPKRLALGSHAEESLSKEQAAILILDFWKNIACKKGGKVDAAWVETFVLLDPDGKLHTAESRREVTLTDQEFGKPHIQFPMRALYISKDTNKPALHHSPQEELLEMKPITDALRTILSE
ncbi:MAG: non-canonical purine NTP pyrophosphatase [Patescibacteria group bacterium]